jgi:hypothetical protein
MYWWREIAAIYIPAHIGQVYACLRAIADELASVQVDKESAQIQRADWQFEYAEREVYREYDDLYYLRG